MEASSPAPDPVAKSNRTVLVVLGSILLVVVVGLVVYFVTRTSEEDKALQAVCSSRSDIQKRVDSLASISPATFTLDQFKSDISGIQNDLKTIKDNEQKLNPDRKAEIQQANEAFKNSVTSTLSSLGTSISVTNAKDKLADAGKQLVESYKTTLAPVDCTGVETS